ncbi:MAG: phosphate-selective porin O and P [uncultured bacterium]|nr:MAG: phosphate-selective porin O and P [uncultured bacterium]
MYDYLNGDFRGISKIRNTYGAWEVALRYSGIDLNDHDIHGGKENDAAIALNWYPFSAIKFGVNYIRANAAPSQNGVDRIVNIVGLMMQARFG